MAPGPSFATSFVVWSPWFSTEKLSNILLKTQNRSVNNIRMVRDFYSWRDFSMETDSSLARNMISAYNLTFYVQSKSTTVYSAMRIILG